MTAFQFIYGIVEIKKAMYNGNYEENLPGLMCQKWYRWTGKMEKESEEEEAGRAKKSLVESVARGR